MSPAYNARPLPADALDVNKCRRALCDVGRRCRCAEFGLYPRVLGPDAMYELRAGGWVVAPWRPSRKAKLSKAKRARILARDAGRCVFCGSADAPEIDHKTPVARGGTNDDDNLQVLCAVCNNSKGALTMDEWVDEMENA